MIDQRLKSLRLHLQTTMDSNAVESHVESLPAEEMQYSVNEGTVSSPLCVFTDHKEVWCYLNQSHINIRYWNPVTVNTLWFFGVPPPDAADKTTWEKCSTNYLQTKGFWNFNLHVCFYTVLSKVPQTNSWV